MAAKLVLIFNNSVVSEHILTAEETTIGRRFANDIHIDNLGISGNHAKIIMFGNNAFVEDMASTNGTYVNGSRVEKKALENNDIITIGKYQLRYENEAGEQQDDFEKTVILQANAVSMENTTVSKPPPTKAGAGKTRLVVASGPSKGKTMVLAKSVTRLGKPGNQAAAIAKRPQGHFFVNLGGDSVKPKLNGSTLSVGAVRLGHGDTISLGSIELTFCND